MRLPELDLLTPPHRQGAKNQPNILVIVFDTLSARHLSLHGYPRQTMPNLERFASQAVVFHQHYATGSFTTPATASMFTGTYPWTHRAFNLHGTLSNDYTQKTFFSLLPEGTNRVAFTHNLLVTSLFRQFTQDIDLYKNTRELSLVDEEYSDLLFPRDYNASFWSEGLILRGGGATPSSLFMALLYKLARLGFKRQVTQDYGSLFPRGVPNLNDIYFVLEDAVDWISDSLAGLARPYLAYFHFLPPHEPYSTRKDFVDVFREDGYKPPAKPKHTFSEGHQDPFLNRQRREYDEYIAYADAELGRLLDFLERNGYLDNTLVMITSDHGELFERGIRGHVTPTLFDPIIHIPLVVRSPGQTQRQDVHTRTSSIDLLPTLLRLTGQPIPDHIEGRLLPYITGETYLGERSLFAMEAKSNPKLAPLHKAVVALMQGDYKLTYYFGYDRIGQENALELFNLKEDPEELNNLASANQTLANAMRKEIEEKLRQVNLPYQR
jgi:arylsulfatase A-like enzyme